MLLTFWARFSTAIRCASRRAKLASSSCSLPEDSGFCGVFASFTSHLDCEFVPAAASVELSLRLEEHCDPAKMAGSETPATDGKAGP